MGIVVLDVEISDINNSDICSEVRMLRGDHSRIPIVAVTSSLPEDTKRNDIAAGINEHITKPIKANDFSRVLWNLLESSPIAVDGNATNSASDAILELGGVDVKGGLDRLKNNWELYRKLLITFRDSNQTLVETLRNHIAQEQFGEAQRVAHTLKGTSGNLSVDEVYHAAAALEKLCKEKDTAEIIPSLTVLEGYMCDVIESLKVLNDDTPMSTTQGAVCHLSDQDLCDSINTLLGYFKSDLGKVNESLVVLNPCLSTSEFNSDYSKMKKAIDSFDIDAATVSANEILSPIIRRIQTRKTGKGKW